MIKLMVFIWRKPGISKAEFARYYEANHAPLVSRLVPAIAKADYRRNFVGEALYLADKTPPAFDAVTEITFADRSEYEQAMRELFHPEVLAQIEQDEANFLDRGKTQMVLVEQHPAAGVDQTLRGTC